MRPDLNVVGGEAKLTSGMLISAGPLFGVAKGAYERTKATGSEREGRGADPLIAIVFSAGALEAFINEVARLATMPLRGEPNPPSVVAFSAVAEEIEGSRAPVRLKFLLAKYLFAGKTYDKGAQPFQDFDLLMALRNALLHLKPEETVEFSPDGSRTVRHSPVIDRLRSRNILAEYDGETTMVALISWISTRAVARWACNAAAAMVRSLLEVVPEGSLKSQLYFFYDTPFQPVV